MELKGPREKSNKEILILFLVHIAIYFILVIIGSFTNTALIAVGYLMVSAFWMAITLGETDTIRKLTANGCIGHKYHQWKSYQDGQKIELRNCNRCGRLRER